MNTERSALLKSLLQLHAPGAWDYQDADPAWPNEHLCVRRIARPYGQLELNVLLRRDGDIDVGFHVSGHRPQRVEAHFPVADHEAKEVLTAVANFVGDFVNERMALAYDRSFFTGGRVFIPVAEIRSVKRRKFDWMISWNGTYDWKKGEPIPKSTSEPNGV